MTCLSVDCSSSKWSSRQLFSVPEKLCATHLGETFLHKCSISNTPNWISKNSLKRRTWHPPLGYLLIVLRKLFWKLQCVLLPFLHQLRSPIHVTGSMTFQHGTFRECVLRGSFNSLKKSIRMIEMNLSWLGSFLEVMIHPMMGQSMVRHYVILKVRTLSKHILAGHLGYCFMNWVRQ